LSDKRNFNHVSYYQKQIPHKTYALLKLEPYALMSMSSQLQNAPAISVIHAKQI